MAKADLMSRPNNENTPPMKGEAFYVIRGALCGVER